MAKKFYGTKKFYELARKYALLQKDPPEGLGVDPVLNALHARIPWSRGIDSMMKEHLEDFIKKGYAHLEEENSGVS